MNGNVGSCETSLKLNESVIRNTRFLLPT